MTWKSNFTTVPPLLRPSSVTQGVVVPTVSVSGGGRVVMVVTVLFRPLEERRVGVLDLGR